MSAVYRKISVKLTRGYKRIKRTAKRKFIMVLGNSDNIKGRKKATKKHSFIVNFYTMLAYIYLGLNLRFCLHRNQSCQMIKGRFLLLPERFKLCTMVNMMYTKLNDAQRYQSTFPGLSVADMDYSPFQLAPSENQNMVKPK